MVIFHGDFHGKKIPWLQEGDGGKMTIEHMSWGMKADLSEHHRSTVPGLVNVNKKLWEDPPCYENGKTHYVYGILWPCSIAFCMFTRG